MPARRWSTASSRRSCGSATSCPSESGAGGRRRANRAAAAAVQRCTMTSVPAALLLAAAFAAPPQGDGPPSQVVVFVRDPSGGPVKDADALFWPDLRPDLPVLEGLAAAPPPRAARGDAGGTVRVPAAPGERGTLLLTTTAGLGAIATRLVAGEAQRV